MNMSVHGNQMEDSSNFTAENILLTFHMERNVSGEF